MTECPFNHGTESEPISTLYGIDPSAPLPTHCACGAQLVYADSIAYIDEPRYESVPGVLKVEEVSFERLCAVDKGIGLNKTVAMEVDIENGKPTVKRIIPVDQGGKR